MTLEEFLAEAEEKDPNNILKDERFGLLEVLKKEGFTDEEAKKMNMKKVWDFYLNSLINSSSKMFSQLYTSLENNPEKATIIKPHLKKMKKQLDEMEEEFGDADSSSQDDID